MIVTRSWLNEWIDLDGISTDELAKTFNAIGLEVDRIKKYEIPEKIVFGHVISCEKHPDADKLNVCQVDIGTAVRQIVCGASNVRAGLDVIVATVGATMPNGMKIKPVKLRGVASDGMICSASEIGLEDIGNGIVELDKSIGNYELGEEVAKNTLLADELIEIELTANRGDCLSIRGVCRDLSAAYDRSLKTYSPDENDSKKGIGRILQLSHVKQVDVDLHYRALDLQSLELPLLVKLRLAQIEQPYKTDLEAILTYATHSSGVILNAYKYEYFAQEDKDVAKIEIARDDNGYVCINAKEKRASVVGIMQEEDSKVNTNDGIVFLEASYIAPDTISKQMFEHKIEAGTSFYKTSRGSEPDVSLGLAFCLDFIRAHSNSSVYSGSVELTNKAKEKVVSITKQEINQFIGANIDKIVISKILTNLGFNISKSSTDNFVISVPQYRHDIVNKQDIVEEIVRLVGIDNIPSKPFILQEENRLKDDYFKYKKKSIFRHRAVQSGFFESIHFVFDEKKVLQEYGFQTTKDELEIVNPIVKTLDTLRPTLLTSLLKSASQNMKNGYSSVKLFEIGSVFSPLREESQMLSMIFCGTKENESLSNVGKPAKIDFAFFVQKVADIIGTFELQSFETKHTLSHPYQSAQIILNGEVIGELFRLHPNVEKSYDLDIAYMCEIEFDKIPFQLKTAKKTSKYQASFRDLSVIVPNEMSYESIKNVIENLNITELIRFYPVDKYSDQDLGENASLSLRFVLQSFEKTLEEEDITSVMNRILDTLNSELGIGLR